MTLEQRIINLKKAMVQKKPKDIVRYKFKLYLNEYDEKEKDVKDKIVCRDLSMDYYRYMQRNGGK